MHFSNPQNLFLLVLIPIFYLFYLWVIRRKGDTAFIFGLSYKAPHLKTFCFLAGILFLVIASGGPQIGVEERVSGRRKADIVIMIDSSLSMLAKDNDKSRFETARILANRLLQRLNGARVGLIAFAAKPVVMSPLTTDTGIVKTFLERLVPDIFWNQGTSIKLALDEGLNMFKKIEGRKKAILLLTDGDDPDARVSELTDNIARHGIKIYTIGIGSEKGSQIPVFSKLVHGDFKQIDGVFMGYKKDAEGRIVITRLNEDALKNIAKNTGGVYYRGMDLHINRVADDLLTGAEVDLSQQALDREKTAESLTTYRDVFRYPLGIAIILFIISRLLTDAKTEKIKTGGVHIWGKILQNRMR